MGFGANVAALVGTIALCACKREHDAPSAPAPAAESASESDNPFDVLKVKPQLVGGRKPVTPRACSFLNEAQGFTMSRLKNSGSGCACTGHRSLADSALGSSLTYSVTCRGDEATRLTLALSVEGASADASAQKLLAETAGALAKSAELSLPSEIREALEQAKPKQSGRFEVLRRELDAAPGLEISFVISL